MVNDAKTPVPMKERLRQLHLTGADTSMGKLLHD